MCGIAGYIGSKKALPFLISGLKKLEYRGYDSAGIAIYDKDSIVVRRQVGKIVELEKLIGNEKIEGTAGIAHTRWATHGAPSNCNSHPHRDGNGNFAVVHNGIIENYLDLRKELQEKGYTFSSETDTEVLPNLIADCYEGDLKAAVLKASKRLRGSYAAVFMAKAQPDVLVAIRKDSPLIVGIGKDGQYLASDIPALIGYVDDYAVMEDGQCAVLTKDGISIFQDNKAIELKLQPLNMDIETAKKGNFEHFMLKEIFEQPRSLRDCLSGRLSNLENRVNLGNISLTKEKLATFNKIVMVACGTAYHACFVGKYIYEKLLRLPVEVDIASEFRYRDPILDEKTLTIVVSQSGETADTKAALKEAQGKGSHVLAITNVWESSIARDADDVIYTRAGMEIAVASTKAYSTQLLCLYLFGFYMVEALGKMDKKELDNILNELYRLPEKVQAILDNQIEEIKEIGEIVADHEDAFFIGRGLDYVVALEGALKLKEISYIHAEAYAAGELKHGTLALIVDQVPVLCLATQSAVAEKMISNIKEVQARDAKILAFAFEGNNKIEQVAAKVCYLPKTDDILAPIVAVIPLQLIAYYASKKRGSDIDQPRNLAKSVTVE
ncbi:MAG: glutamine--fructose-6-phosphate transaminase (isomerizing) [Clostridiales bacterium]